MKGSQTILFRVDGSVATGTGHVMRCLALAQAWQDVGGKAVFAMAEGTSALRDRLLADSCQVLGISAEPGTRKDAGQTAALAGEQHAEWIVVDGYRFSAEYQCALRAAGYKVLFIDDCGQAGRYSAHLVLNQNVGATESLYQNRDVHTRLLLGPRYCLLRREFNGWRDYVREIPPAGHRVLITLGGSDSENLTARMLRAAASVKVENLEVTVVLGGSNPHFDSLQQTALKLAKQSAMKITLRKDVANMGELMAWADVAISAAGSTCWELCLLALPALLIDVAKNQTAVARELHRLGCAIHLGGTREISIGRLGSELERMLGSWESRRNLSRQSRELVDGSGSQRVISVLRGGGDVYLRRVQEEDSRLLWEWANDPVVRSASFSSAPIPWESHIAWFSGKLREGKCFIWIAEDAEGIPFGQIRFEIRSDGDSEVGVSIAQAKRGQGLADRLIALGVERFMREHHCPRVHAFVKAANAASVRAFEKADFKRAETMRVREEVTVHVILERTGTTDATLPLQPAEAFEVTGSVGPHVS